MGWKKRINWNIFIAFAFIFLASTSIHAQERTEIFSFSDSSNYLVSNPSSVQFTGTGLSLRQLDQTDDDSSATGFGGGTSSGAVWNEDDQQLEVSSSQLWELPDEATSDGWLDMSDNLLLLHLNEISGEIVTDSSGTGNNGTIIGTESVEGAIGNARHFEGGTIDNIIQINPVSSFPTDQLTVMFWIRSSTRSWRSILSYASTASDNEFLIAKPSNLSIYRGSTALSTGVDVGDGAWHAVAITWDGTTGDLHIYRDGILEHSTILAADTSITGSGSLVLGQEQDSVGGNFDPNQALEGDLDEIAVFSRILSSEEIEAFAERRTLERITHNFDSRIMDAMQQTAWGSLSWRPSAPDSEDARILFQVRVCDDPLCDGEEFVGPDGSSDSFYSDLTNTTTDLRTFELTNLDEGRYFQCRAIFEAESLETPPPLSEVRIGPVQYDPQAPTVTNRAGIPFDLLRSFQHTEGAENRGEIHYQISHNREVWFFHNGAGWVTASGVVQTNSAEELNNVIDTFPDEIDTGSFYFRAFLISNGTQPVILEQVELESTLLEDIAANSGPDRVVIAGRSIQLNGRRSSGTGILYNWAIISGEGRLANATSATPTFTSFADSETQDVLIYLTVIDAGGRRSTDEITIRVLKQATASRIDNTIVGGINGVPFQEILEVDDSGIERRAIKFEGTTVYLPTNDEEYALSITSDNRLVIGVPTINEGSGQAFVFETRIENLSELIDLAGASPPDAALITTLSGNDPSSTRGLVIAEGNDMEDHFGKYVSAGDLNGDGCDEVVVSAPDCGEAGCLYIYDCDGELIGLIQGTNDYPIASVTTANILDTPDDDIIIGPDNRSLNENLFLGEAVKEDVSENLIILRGNSDWDGVTFLNDFTVNLVVGGPDSIYASNYGDLNRDGNEDLVVTTDNGSAFLFWGPLPSDGLLMTEDADVTLISESSSEAFGQSLAVGDINGDNWADIAIGAPFAKGNQGSIYILFGEGDLAGSIDFSSAENAMIIPGNSEHQNIGNDLLLVDENEDDTLDILTPCGEGIICSVNIANGVSGGDSEDPGEDEEDEDGEDGTKMSGGCNLVTGTNQNTTIFTLWLFFILTFTACINLKLFSK